MEFVATSACRACPYGSPTPSPRGADGRNGEAIEVCVIGFTGVWFSKKLARRVVFGHGRPLVPIVTFRRLP